MVQSLVVRALADGRKVARRIDQYRQPVVLRQRKSFKLGIPRVSTHETFCPLCETTRFNETIPFQPDETASLTRYN